MDLDSTPGEVEVFRDGVLIASGADFDGFHSVLRRPDETAATFFVCEVEETNGFASRCSNAVTLTYRLNDAGLLNGTAPAHSDLSFEEDLEASDDGDAQ